MKVISKQHNSRMCIVCGMENPIGFKAQFYNMEDGSVMTQFTYREEHQSFPFRVHGGLIATMLDELGLRALWTNGREDVFGVTTSIEVKYRKPVPYGQLLTGRGIVVRESSRFAVIDTGIYDETGALLSNSQVKYIKIPVEQIAPGADAHQEMGFLIPDEVKEIPFPQP